VKITFVASLTCDRILTLTLNSGLFDVFLSVLVVSLMSRALFSIRARYALDPLASSPTCKSLRFSLVSTTRRLHVHAETAPFTFHHVPEGGRRLTTPTSSPDTFSSLSQHLNQTFPPLKFSPELAQRILTHISHRDSLIGHNSRFSFLGIAIFIFFLPLCPLLSSNLSLSITGRRTLEAYLLLFLQGLPVAAEHDHARIADRVLNTHSLGEHVAPHWRLLDVMRWVSPLAGQPGLDGREAGQYKVAGTTVEAIVGGILHQFVRLLACFKFALLSELTNES
jgi:Ribonuclease-III-like